MGLRSIFITKQTAKQSSPTSNICQTGLSQDTREKRQHVQKPHTWTSAGSQLHNNKHSKVCGSLTVYCAWLSTPQTVRENKQREKLKCRGTSGTQYVLISIPKYSPSVDSDWISQIKTSSLNRNRPGVFKAQPHLRTIIGYRGNSNDRRIPLNLSRELCLTMLTTREWG